ncbi:methyltransferase type 11 [bacterium]|nr:methyltransferase type 11 [bacterium]
MKLFRRFASPILSNNLSSRFRNKRAQILLDKLSALNLDEIKILDVGGSSYFWDEIRNSFKKSYQLVIVNLSKEEIGIGEYQKIVGDGKTLSFIKDKSFDIVVSNSVMEHLGTFNQQREMAENIKRVGRYYFIQTPAFIFPFEPHFLFPFFHWLPKWVRVKLVQNFNLGWFTKQKSKEDAQRLVNSIRILKKKELKRFFQNFEIISERLWFFTKSYLVISTN